MRIKIVEQFDSHFTLDPEATATLFALLKSAAFLQQVCQQVNITSPTLPPCQQVEFTELLFQPTPYTLEATRGMPPEYESYLDSPDYAIINVPPNFMFKAKIFQPSRLCAIYRVIRDRGFSFGDAARTGIG
jgi:hypothetical protein